MNKIIFLGLLLNFYPVFAQEQREKLPTAGVPQTIEIEVNGRPTWQKIIPLGRNGVLLFVKKDITKAIIARFDTNLKKVWESEVFLDAEKPPVHYTLDNEHITFMFSENQGMYYQLYIIGLTDGKFENKGFEIREFFQDQGYVYLKDKLLLAGMKENGGAFFEQNLIENESRLISAELIGKVQLQQINFKPKTNLVESLWAVKESAFANEKKKRGEFIKNAYVVYAKHDTLGKLIYKNAIQSNAGNFPLTAKITVIDSTTKIITGTYQSNTGTKGIYFSKIENDKTTLTKFYDYAKLLSDNASLNSEQLKKIYASFSFLPALPVFSQSTVTLGGYFYQSNYKVVSTDNPKNGGFDINSNNTNNRTKTKQVLTGYNYADGFVASFDLEGNLLTQNRIELNQTSPRIDDILAINEKKSVAVCAKGNLSIFTANNFSEPSVYKLSAENGDAKNAQYIPNYRSVRNWYDNYFIADGSRIKFEVIKENNSTNAPASKRKKSRRQFPETNTKKIIYLTKVLGAEF